MMQDHVRRSVVLALGLLVMVSSVFAQRSDTDAAGSGSDTRSSTGDTDQRLVLARGLSEYPVTVGDQYRIYLQRGNSTSQINFSVPGTYEINLGPVGSFSVQGLTQEELKLLVEDAVTDAYPSSFPRLELLGVGIFRVRLTGSIPESRTEEAWGLTTLEELTSDVDMSEASLRRVTVVSRNNQRRTYDLFRAQRGEDDENPLVRPGDRIVFNPRSREISVRGEVRFPGTYELTASDNLQDVIEQYAGGLTELSLRERIEVRRVADDGAARRIDYTNRSERRFELADGDRVVVRSRVETFPIVYVEGALEPPPSEAENADGAEAGQPPETRSRVIRRTLYQGETLLDVLRSIEGRLHSDANLREGLVRRRATGEDRPVDMEALLYERRTELDIELETNDRIIIPFGIFEVFISGEVTQAGFEDVRSLDRLSRVVGPYMTDYSSRRDVTVRSATGAEQTYDLFRALRYGERDQNPYLQPGDTVIVSRRDRQVRVTGEVERPGTYQLLPGEQLATLLEEYAGGLTELSLRERIEVRRSTDEGSARRIDYTNRSERRFELADGDRVVVRSRVETFPIVYVE
ncbi:MAG: SLBB domain-containing protein, partial [Alkalispirochaeta sp.]